MNTTYLIRAKKIVTVSRLKTIENGAMLIHDGKIAEINLWEALHNKYPNLHVKDFGDAVITPSLIDCHTHLLEFAPSSLFPVTQETHFIGGSMLLFQALSSGITALGEQICGHPLCDFPIEKYRKTVEDLPLDVSFASTSISIGFEQIAHFSSITKSRKITKEELLDPNLIRQIAACSDYPGENIFINATPANFTEKEVPRAGEVIYTLEDLTAITDIYHSLGKRMGAHVAGEVGIKMALDAGIDVLHHAHGITDPLIWEASKKPIHIVATPLGGTHLQPNSPEDIVKLVQSNIPVSISSDSYLPPYKGASWLPFKDDSLKGPDVLMLISNPAMRLLKQECYDENDILALLTLNPAKVLGKSASIGSLEPGKEANFIVAEGVPGLEITENEKIRKVYVKGVKVIDRDIN